MPGEGIQPGAHALLRSGPAHKRHRSGVRVRDALGEDSVAPPGVVDFLVRDLNRDLDGIKDVLGTAGPKLKPQLLVLGLPPGPR
jgi:hypothetical protein